jgi:anti-sigma regulatory factor (Ser/Thr protein kinase)
MSALAWLGWLLTLALLPPLAIARAREARGARRLARAAHELRGGLCAARLALEAAGGGAVGAADLELRRAALALDELERAASAAFEPVPLADLLARQLPVWRALAAAHGARVELAGAPSPGACLEADPAALAQAFTNLVANAAEHGGGTVCVRLRVAPPGAPVRFEVADEGPGLPAPLPALLAAGRRARGARGHGLAIAADVAARHGGRLVTAPSSRGARLVLELPATASGAQSALPAPAHLALLLRRARGWPVARRLGPARGPRLPGPGSGLASTHPARGPRLAEPGSGLASTHPARGPRLAEPGSGLASTHPARGPRLAGRGAPGVPGSRPARVASPSPPGGRA